MLIKLGLAVVLAATTAIVAHAQRQPRTIALIYSPADIRLMRHDEAERLWQRLKRRNSNPRTFAALTQALGVVTEVPHVRDVRARLDWEIRRGVRRPLQRLSRD